MQHELNLLCAIIPAGGTVADIGAGIGIRTLAFGRRVGRYGSVHALEWRPTLFALLSENLANNQNLNIVAHRCWITVSPESPGADVHKLGTPTAVAGRNENANSRLGHPRIVLDELALEHCHLVFLDAKGEQGGALAGMTATLSRLHPVLYMRCGTVDLGADAIGALMRSDYRFFLVRAMIYNPSNHRGNPDNISEPARDTGLLCVPACSRGRVPSSTPLVEILPVASLDALAGLVLTTPRPGDTTQYESIRDELRRSSGALLRSDFRVASLTRQLAQAEMHLAAERRMLQICEAARKEEAAAHQREIQVRDESIAALLASTSWRVTAPLRYFASIVRGRQICDARVSARSRRE